MKAHYLQHVPFEGLGCIEAWLLERGYEISRTAFHADGKLPEIEEVDFLIIMGGPMSVNDEKEYPWLIKEKAFVRAAIKKGVPILGICLGAQLIANSLGAKVYPNKEKEIGWFPIQSFSAGKNCGFSEEITVLHWHGETFDLPEGATLLASSKACENQAFQLADNIIGLQFHLEMIPESVQSIMKNCKDELCDSPYVQSEYEILAADQKMYQQTNRLMHRVLEYCTRERTKY